MAIEPPPGGWLVVDKPAGITSSRVVIRLKHATGMKAGHAGTLDPLATGILPVALGEATKTVRFILKARKCYSFRVRWGIATDTDDSEGEIVAEHLARPDEAAIREKLSRFLGTIAQRPPAFSAVKIAGRPRPRGDDGARRKDRPLSPARPAGRPRAFRASKARGRRSYALARA